MSRKYTQMSCSMLAKPRGVRSLTASPLSRMRANLGINSTSRSTAMICMMMWFERSVTWPPGVNTLSTPPALIRSYVHW